MFPSLSTGVPQAALSYVRSTLDSPCSLSVSWDISHPLAQPTQLMQPCPRVCVNGSCCPGAGRALCAAEAADGWVSGQGRFAPGWCCFEICAWQQTWGSGWDHFLVSSLCNGFSGRSLPSPGGHVPPRRSSAVAVCVCVLCSSECCFTVAGQLWPLPTKGSPCRRH